jgi:hypothetical protein
MATDCHDLSFSEKFKPPVIGRGGIAGVRALFHESLVRTGLPKSRYHVSFLPHAPAGIKPV